MPFPAYISQPAVGCVTQNSLELSKTSRISWKSILLCDIIWIFPKHFSENVFSDKIAVSRYLFCAKEKKIVFPEANAAWKLLSRLSRIKGKCYWDKIEPEYWWALGSFITTQNLWYRRFSLELNSQERFKQLKVLVFDFSFIFLKARIAPVSCLKWTWRKEVTISNNISEMFLAIIKLLHLEKVELKSLAHFSFRKLSVVLSAGEQS